MSNFIIPANCIHSGLSDPKMLTMNFLNEIANKYPEAISFGPGRPLEKNFNVENSFNYIKRYLEASNVAHEHSCDYSSLGQYGNTKGILGEIICKLIKNDEDIIANSNDIVVTVGCQEAIFLCLLLLAKNSNDVILVEDPSYVGILGPAKILGVEVVPVPTDDNGIILDDLSVIVTNLKKEGKSPRLLYTSPDFSNPSGATTSLSHRLSLLELTRKMNLIILEDHAYNYFYFGKKIKSLKSLKNSQHVIYLGSFSKSIFPSVRVGFLVADQIIDAESNNFFPLSDEISKIKSFLTVNTSALTQAIVGGLIVSENYSLISYTEKSRAELKKNYDVMLESLALFFPSDEAWCIGVRWNIPQGGFFITLELPFYISDTELYTCVRDYGVIWTPMTYFYVNEKPSRSIRLSFSYVTELQIREGIKKLSLFVQEYLNSRRCFL